MPLLHAYTAIVKRQMLITTELRWFARGRLPKPLWHWFQNSDLGGERQPLDSRTDQYLYIPGCEFLNVKFRAGQLDVKWRQAKLQPFSLLGLPPANLERWLKWSDESAEADLPFDFEARKDWIGVQKQRSQRVYQCSKSSNAAGCSVELTQLYLQNQPWWSLAFEATGHPDSQSQYLQGVAHQIEAQCPSDLQPYWHSLQQAFAYPRWLLAAGVSPDLSA